MRQTVYLDILILLNSIINFYILFITGAMSRSRIIRIRLLIGGLLGGALSATILLPEMNDFLSFLFKALTSAIIVFISFEPQSKRVFLRRYIYYMAVNFIFAGAVLFCCFLFSTPLIYYNNSNFYFDISAPFLIVIATLTYILITVTVKRSDQPMHIQKFYDLEIRKSGETVKCTAFADTGNALKDVFTGDPIIVADYGVIDRLLPGAFRSYFVTDDAAENIDAVALTEGAEEIRLVPFSSVGGAGFLKAFRCDEIKITGDNKAYSLSHGYIAVYNGELSSGNYGAIINPEIFDVAREVA